MVPGEGGSFVQTRLLVFGGTFEDDGKMKLMKPREGAILACDRRLKKNVTELEETQYRSGRIVFCRRCGKYWKLRGDSLLVHERGKKLFLPKSALSRILGMGK